MEIWNSIAYELKRMGYFVIENVMNYQNHIEGAVNLELSVSELIQIGMYCHSIISYRSGLCDIFAGKGNRLYVLSREQRDMEFKRRYSFEDNFLFNEKGVPNEIFLSKYRKPILKFEGNNLLKNVSKKHLPENTLRKSFIKNLLQTLKKRWKNI